MEPPEEGSYNSSKFGNRLSSIAPNRILPRGSKSLSAMVSLEDLNDRPPGVAPGARRDSALESAVTIILGIRGSCPGLTREVRRRCPDCRSIQQQSHEAGVWVSGVEGHPSKGNISSPKVNFSLATPSFCREEICVHETAVREICPSNSE